MNPLTLSTQTRFQSRPLFQAAPSPVFSTRHYPSLADSFTPTFGHGHEGLYAPQPNTLDTKHYDVGDGLTVTIPVVDGKKRFVMLPGDATKYTSFAKYIAHSLIDHPERSDIFIFASPKHSSGHQFANHLIHAKNYPAHIYGERGKAVPPKYQALFDKFSNGEPQTTMYQFHTHAFEKLKDSLIPRWENELAFELSS